MNGLLSWRRLTVKDSGGRWLKRLSITRGIIYCSFSIPNLNNNNNNSWQETCQVIGSVLVIDTYLGSEINNFVQRVK